MTAVVITTDGLSGGFISVRTLRGCGGLFRRRSFRIFNGVTPRFFRGFVSLWRRGRIRHTERALSRYAKLIIFIGGKFGKFPLITLVIIVIHICVNEGLRLFIAFAGFRLSADMILHMTEETFPRRVIPTVSPSGHGLAQIFLLKNPNKFAACVMRPLIAVRDGFLMKRYPVFPYQRGHGFQNEIHLKRVAERISQNLFGIRVQNGGQISDSNSLSSRLDAT